MRRGLDRKHQVESIRTKVDDVIRRSQAEVQKRVGKASYRAEYSNQNVSGTRGRSGGEEREQRANSRRTSPLRENHQIQENRRTYQGTGGFNEINNEGNDQQQWQSHHQPREERTSSSPLRDSRSKSGGNNRKGVSFAKN